MSSGSSSNTGSEDVDDSGTTHQNVNQESKDKMMEKPKPDSLDDQEEDKNLATPVQSASEVTIISAMKGSREKHGKSPEKLSVSWDEDVYDPPPSIVSHTVGNKPQQSQTSNSKGKNKKKGQRGSSSSPRGRKNK